MTTIFCRYLPGVRRWFKFSTILENVRRKREVFRKIIDEHKATLDPDNPRDLIDNYLIKMLDVRNANDATPGGEFYTGDLDERFMFSNFEVKERKMR